MQPYYTSRRETGHPKIILRNHSDWKKKEKIEKTHIWKTNTNTSIRRKRCHQVFPRASKARRGIAEYFQPAVLRLALPCFKLLHVTRNNNKTTMIKRMSHPSCSFFMQLTSHNLTNNNLKNNNLMHKNLIHNNLRNNNLMHKNLMHNNLWQTTTWKATTSNKKRWMTQGHTHRALPRSAMLQITPI